MSQDHTRLPPTRGEGQGLTATVEDLRAQRKARALAIWRASGSQSSSQLADSLLGDVLELALSDFAAIYKSARGYDIDPVYITAVRHDVLIAIEAAALAEAWGSSPKASQTSLRVTGKLDESAANAGDRTQDHPQPHPPGGNSHEG